MKTFLQIRNPLSAIAFFGLATIGNAQFQQDSKIVGDRESRAEFGSSAAISDNFAVVGASRETIATGAAYVYRKDENGSWVFSEKITAFDGAEMAEFGGSVKLSEDLLVISAGRADINGVLRAGALYVYERAGDVWEFKNKIAASDYSDGALLGVNPTTLDVQENLIVAGAPGEFNWLGSVYIFEKDADNWNETKIISPDMVDFGNFGIGVSISGNTLIAGASGEDNGAGSAYIFERNNDGDWEFMQKISASDAQPNAYFGNSVSIDGNQMVIGAYAEGSVGGNIAAAYIFERNDAGEWIEIQKIPSPASDENTFFGWLCKMDGNQMAITAPHVWGLEPGQVFLYHKLDGGLWEQVQVVEADEEVEEFFYGWSVDLHNGNLIVGAPRDDFDENGENEMMDAGSAFIFVNPNLGITGQEASSASVKIYPNPAENQLNIFSTENIRLVEVFDLSGKRILSTNQSVVNVSSYPKGTYILKISLISGKTNTLKFIKK